MRALTPERWREVKAVLAGALEVPADARAAFVDRACGDDPALRREVVSLLSAEVAHRELLATAPAGDGPRPAPGGADGAEHRAAPRATLESALAGRYAVEREIGRGGMASVYLAHDLKHDRLVALKVLRPDLGAVLGAERFLREIGITAHLQHPNILPLFDSGEAGGLLYYVMPFVAGESLRARLRRGPRMPIGEALTVAGQVAAALDHAHRAGVVHRDVKPENILLHEGQAFVADFGVACAVSAAVSAAVNLALEPAADDRLTATGLVVGTPLYMSPEQAAGEREIDGRSDVYALGCVLYEMLAGEPPFGGASAGEIFARKLTREPPPLRVSRDGLPPAADELIARMLARDPARRPTGPELDRALEALRRVASPALVAPARRRGWPGLTVGVVAAVLAVTVLLTAVVARSFVAAGRTLDPNLLVIAPFTTMAARDAVWREGLPEVLGRDLDAAGTLRVVPSSVALRAWPGDRRADRASAVALARSTRAGLVLFGALSPLGADSVQLVATLVDARAGGVVSEREATGASDRLTRLADSVALGLLLDLANRRGTGTARPAGSIGSASLPAIRAFLRGDQAFRRAEWDSAQRYYEQAVALDSTFALAIRQLGRLAAWRSSGIGVGVPRGDSIMLVFARRGSRHAKGLGARDSLLILSDSLIGAVAPDLCIDAAARRRALAVTEELVERFPADPETWLTRGDALYVCGGYFSLNEPGAGKREMLAAYDSAIARDSGFAQAYDRTFRLALDLGDTARALRRAAKYLTLHPPEAHAAYLRLLTTMIRRPQEASAVLDTMPAFVVYQVFTSLLIYPDSAESSVALARRLASESARGGAWDVYRGLFGRTYAAPHRRRALAFALAYRGHLREAAALVGTTPSLFASPLTGALALLGATPSAAADSAFRAWLHERPFRNDEEMASVLAWWGERRDTVALREYLRQAGAPWVQSPLTGSERQYAHRREVARAYIALARADTAAAVRLLASAPSHEWWMWERLVLARLLVARGRPDSAFAVLDRGFPYPRGTPLHGLWAIEQARLASRLGYRDEARASYEYVVRVWRAADPELQPVVREARAALTRLGARGARAP